LIGNGIPVFASHEIIPEAREYERTSTTVIASYLAPVVADYLAALSHRLESIGAPSQFWVMKSSGGLFSSEAARLHPEELVESGPAAGVIGAAAAGRDLGITDLIAFDMGGTTAKASLVRDGTPGVNYEYEVGGAAHAGGFLRKGTGYPLRVPVLDIAEVGTGGGSIAWVDNGGALRVGPKSAGAVPGPACYGLGGTKPTVTDADLVLGYLDARSSAQYLGSIDREKSRAAIEEHVARPLGISIEAAALGIFDLANAQMTDAVRLVSVAKGFDTRELALVAFGGAGPLHAWAIARELGIASVLIPAHPGVFSAVGLLWADFRIDRSRGVRLTLGAPGTAEAMQATLAELGASAESEARAQGAASDVVVRFSGDLRYVGQSYELNVPIETAGNGIDAAALRATFNREHERVYGHASETEPLEVIALRATATLPGDQRRFEDRAVATAGTESHRPIVFHGGEVQARVVDRASIDGAGVAGPAAVVQVDTTTIVPPGARIARADNGFLILHVSEEAP
jgi:N-methylhydantoinase A